MKQLVARCEALVHRHGVEIRLDRRPHLTAPLSDHVVLKGEEVRSADIGAYLARLAVHCHEAGSEEGLGIYDGVPRGHHGVTKGGDVAISAPLVSKYLHIGRLVKGGDDLLLGYPGCSHSEVASTLTDSSVNDLISLLGRDAIGEGRIGTS